MRLHRFEASATLEPGRLEGVVGGTVRLVTLRLGDGGAVADRDGGEHHEPDVETLLRPGEARERELAFELLMLAEQAERLSGGGSR